MRSPSRARDNVQEGTMEKRKQADKRHAGQFIHCFETHRCMACSKLSQLSRKLVACSSMWEWSCVERLRHKQGFWAKIAPA